MKWPWNKEEESEEESGREIMTMTLNAQLESVADRLEYVIGSITERVNELTTLKDELSQIRDDEERKSSSA